MTKDMVTLTNHLKRLRRLYGQYMAENSHEKAIRDYWQTEDNEVSKLIEQIDAGSIGLLWK